MKTMLRQSFVWMAGLLCAELVATADNFRLEPRVYLFKDDTSVAPTGPAIFHAPAAVRVGNATLTLADADYSWSGGQNPPAGVTEVKLPVVITPAGKPVQLLSAASVQYLEKVEGDRLVLRTIAKESAEAPHCRITLQVERTSSGTASIQVSSTISLATVASREKIDGVDLEVGRPVLARFAEQIELPVRFGEWTALLVRTPNNASFSLLLLLKAAPAAAAARSEGAMTQTELVSFLTYYYRSPEPERIAAAMEALKTSDLLGKATADAWGHHQSTFTCLGFFSAVFARHPERTQEWRKVIERGPGGDFRYWLRRLLKSEAKAAQVAAPSIASLRQEVHFFWGAFTATGDTAYLRRMIERFELLDSTTPEAFDAGAQAMLLLANNAPAHPLIVETLRDIRSNMNSRTRELIDDLLMKDLAGVKQQIEAVGRPSHGPWPDWRWPSQ